MGVGIYSSGIYLVITTGGTFPLTMASWPEGATWGYTGIPDPYFSEYLCILYWQAIM